MRAITVSCMNVIFRPVPVPKLCRKGTDVSCSPIFSISQFVGTCSPGFEVNCGQMDNFIGGEISNLDNTQPCGPPQLVK